MVRRGLGQFGWRWRYKMVLPTIMFPGLGTIELILFQTLQTALNITIFFLILYFIEKYFITKREKREGPDKRRIITTIISCEISNICVSVLWIFLTLFALVGFVSLLLLYFAMPFMLIYLQYYDKPNLKEPFVAIIYLSSFMVAFLISATITSTIFNLIGIENYFVLI